MTCCAPVAKAFGIRVPQDDKASLLAAIEAFLLMLFQQNKRALLIVDEAQNLNAGSIEELRMLSNFQCGDQALLQSFLVGQPELRDLMRSPAMEQFRQRVIASYHLGPLDEDETRGLHRAPPASRGLEGRSGVRPIGLSRSVRRHRRRAAPHQCDLQSAAARGFPVRPASLWRRTEVAAVAAEITGEIGPQALVDAAARVAPRVQLHRG